MADQMEPQENPLYREQPVNAGQQDEPTGPNPVQAQRFIAPAESFGAFGTQPDESANLPYNNQPSSPPSIPGYPAGTTPGYYPAGATPGYPASPVPGYPTPGYPTPSMPGYPPMATGYSSGYPAGTMPVYPIAPGMPPYTAYPAPVHVKKPIYFPLTRRMPVLLQVFGMLLYSLIMALSIMGCILILLRAAVMNTNVYVNLDGSTNGLSIFITIALILLVLPFSSLLSGAFFGSLARPDRLATGGWRRPYAGSRNRSSLWQSQCYNHVLPDLRSTSRRSAGHWPGVRSPQVRGLVEKHVYHATGGYRPGYLVFYIYLHNGCNLAQS